MLRTSIMLLLLFLAGFCLESPGQSRATSLASQGRGYSDEGSPVVPAERGYRPRVSLQEALKIAERYVDRDHIDISAFWLYRAKFIMDGDPKSTEKDKLFGWHFWWVHESGGLGDYVEIIVNMDGVARRVPSM